jgi:hypothetical protein
MVAPALRSVDFHVEVTRFLVLQLTRVQAPKSKLRRWLRAEIEGQPITEIVDQIGSIRDGNQQNEILQTEAVPDAEGPLNFFSLFGIGRCVDFTTRSEDPAVRSGLLRAAASTELLLKERAARLGVKINGWQVMLEAGRYDDYLSRAALAWMGGAWAKLPEDALYPMAFTDGDGKPLDGRNRYVLRFEKGQTPPVDGFWSLSVYGVNQNLVSNPIDRFAIGDRSAGLKYADDGSLTIYIQTGRPPGANASNWLPARSDRFVLAMRAYSPKQPILDLSYQWPPVHKVD